MSDKDVDNSDSIDLSDRSPLVSWEVSPRSSSYGGIDSVVFIEDDIDKTSPNQEKSSKSKEVKDSHLTDDDVIQEVKRISTNERSSDLDKTTFYEASRRNPVKYLDCIRELPCSIRQRKCEARRVREQLGKEYLKTQHNRNMPRETLKTSKAIWEGSFGLMDYSIKKIQAYLGSGVASYFVFLRRMIWMDLFIALVAIGFICIPQVIQQEGTILDLNQNGLGILQNSLVFYGYYESTEMFARYQMPLAYLLTIIAIIALSVIVIVVWMSVSYRKSKLSGTEEEYDYAWRLFSSWDYSISSSEGTSDLQVAIRTDIQETIWEHKVKVKKRLSQRMCLAVIRVLTNLVVLGLLGGSGIAIYFVSTHRFEDGTLGIFQDIFDEYQLSMVVAGLKLIMPPLFVCIAYLEDWTPRMELNITLARTMFFYNASLLVFILSLFASFEAETSTVTCLNSTAVEPVILTSTAIPSPVLTTCWETYVGQEIFKLLLLDFGLIVAVLLVSDVLLALLVKSRICCNRISYKSFNITTGVLDIVYNQGLIWIGMYFSPLVPLFGVIKLSLTYGLVYIVARKANVPPKKLYRASRSGNFSMLILLINLFVCIYPLMVVFFELRPSPDCGPFRNYCFVHEVFTAEIGELPEWLAKTLEFISSPEVIIPIILLLLLIVVFYKTKSSSYKRVIKDLRNQLKFERRDVRRKVFHDARASDSKKCKDVRDKTD